MLPELVRLRAQEARDAARRLVKESDQLRDRADVLMREAEARSWRLGWAVPSSASGSNAS